MKITKKLLYTSTAIIPFYIFRLTIFDIPTNIFELFIGLSLIIFLLEYVAKNGWNFKFGTKKTGIMLILLFLSTSLIGILNSNDLLDSAGIIKSFYFVPAIYYFMLVFTFKKQEIPKISQFLLISLIIVILWAILQKFGVIKTLFYQVNDTSFDQYLASPIRLFAGFESPNALAMYILPATLLCLPAFQKTGSKKIQYATLSPILLLAFLILIFAGSRAALLATIVIAIISAIYALKSKIQPKILYLLCSLFLVSLIFFILTSFNRGDSNSSRIEIYRYSIELIKSNYLQGIGFASFQSDIALLAKSNRPFIQYTLPYALHPHNLFFAFQLYAGIFHLLSALALIIYYIKNALTKISRTTLLSALAIIAMLIHGLFDTTYFKNDLAALFFLAIALIDIEKSND